MFEGALAKIAWVMGESRLMKIVCLVGTLTLFVLSCEGKISDWVTNVSSRSNRPGADRIIILRRGSLPRIFLEIDAPGLRSPRADQRQLGRRAIQGALNALQAALDSPTEFAEFHADRD